MFKKISLFLALVLVIGALSACAGSSPKLSDERKEVIDSVWLAQHANKKWNWYDGYRGLCCYYGTYQGYDILLHQQSGVTSIDGGSEEIAGYLFSSIDPFDLLGYRNGIFYDVSDLYNDGKLSKESIAAAFEVHNSEERTLPLSDEKKEEISNNWIAQYYGLKWNSKKDQVGTAIYYGNIEGYEVFFLIESIPENMMHYFDDGVYTITVGDSTFADNRCIFDIVTYKDAKFRNLRTLYEEGIFDAEMVEAIALRHRRLRYPG